MKILPRTVSISPTAIRLSIGTWHFCLSRALRTHLKLLMGRIMKFVCLGYSDEKLWDAMWVRSRMWRCKQWGYLPGSWLSIELLCIDLLFTKHLVKEILHRCPRWLICL